ncbi:MAG TPA: ATP-binding protein, partial [Humisphaera sp.]
MRSDATAAAGAATVLVVDDNPATLYATGRVLRAAGFTVLEAASGSEACAVAERAGPHVVILDVHLPDIDGFEVCRRLRANDRTSRTPVIHLSATFVKDVDKVQGLEAGADGYLTHPVEPPVLVATVNAFLRARRAEDAVRESRDRLRLAVAAADLAQWDWDVLEDRITWSEDLVRRQGGGGGGGDAPRTVAAFSALVHPDDRDRVALDVNRALVQGGRYRSEFRMLCPDGRTRWVLAMAETTRDADGRVVRLQGVELDITERKLAEEALRRRQRELQTVADNTPDILTRFDRTFRHVFVNRAVERATGLPLSAFLGRTNRELGMPADLCDRWERALTDVFETGRTGSVEFVFDAPDGVRHFASKLVPEVGGDGRVEFVLGVTHDVTVVRREQAAAERARAEAERARAEAERARAEAERARADAERANAAKDRFLAVLSHELRTPLNPVLMAAAALRRDPSLPPAVREDMEMIHRNVELETRLIDDLLDLTRVAHGKLALRSDRVNLADRVREVVRMVDAEAAARQVTLTVDTGADGGAAAGAPFVTGDAARLQQVVWNLLKNAIKFTPAGGRVRVSAAAAGGRARLAVADTGVGIDPAVLPHVFDAFEQGGERVTRRFGGLGLGLSISRALIDLHGGTLTADSPGVGRGATFTVEL